MPEKEKKRKEGRRRTRKHIPTNIGTTRATPTATPLAGLVTGSKFGLLWVAALRVHFFFIILTPALVLGQLITKRTLTILVGILLVGGGLAKERMELVTWDKASLEKGEERKAHSPFSCPRLAGSPPRSPPPAGRSPP